MSFFFFFILNSPTLWSSNRYRIWQYFGSSLLGNDCWKATPLWQQSYQSFPFMVCMVLLFYDKAHVSKWGRDGACRVVEDSTLWKMSPSDPCCSPYVIITTSLFFLLPVAVDNFFNKLHRVPVFIPEMFTHWA